MSEAVPPIRILLVEDQPEFVALVEGALASEGWAVDLAGDGPAALQLAHANDPDVVLLDLGLPGMDGVEVCRQLRTFTNAYVVMLTGRDEEVDKIVGLAVGADDYLTKPFSPRELVARIKAMLRRPRVASADEPADDTGVRRFGALAIDPASREVTVDDEHVELTKIEFDLLDVLSANPKMVLTRAVLVERVWGPNWFGDTHVVDVHIANLRKKIDLPGSPSYLKTVRGVGYRMAPPT